jgi:predicted nucleic acid-binding protein
MMFILDTNVVSELRKVRIGKAHPNVIRWAEEQNADALYISAITVLELEIGIMQIERRAPPQGLMLRSWLEQQVLSSLRNAHSRSIRRLPDGVHRCTSPTPTPSGMP